MAKKQESSVVSLLAWITGVVVSLVVGNGMISKVLSLPSWLGGATEVGIIVSQAIGWIVVITTLIGAVMAILRR